MATFTGAFLAGLAADLTGRVLKAGGAKVREVISGTEEEKALGRCIWAGVVALVARASIDEPVKTRKLEKLFEKFFSASFVAWELSKLLKGRELDKEVLTDLFEQAGYSAEILPGLDIATGIDLFEAAFAEAAEREPALQGQIQAGNPREQTHLQRDMRAGIQEMVSLLRNAEPGSIAISQGQIVIENVGQISIFQQGGGGMAEQDESEPLRTAYLNHLFETVGRLSLTGIDPKAASDAEARLDLGAVYTALLTLTPEECERIRDRGCLEPEMREVRRLSALEHLNEKHRLVLLGDPGSGKSTFVNFVALCLAGEALGKSEANLSLLTEPLPEDDEYRHREEAPKRQPWSHGTLLPVRIVLRDFAARGLPPSGQSATAQHLWDFIAGELKSAALASYAEHLRRHLMKSGGLILLDGLDEVPEAEHRREEIKDAVEDFAAVFHKCRFLTTSRTYAYQQQAWRLKDFSETILAPFGGGQIRRFADRWYAHIAQLRGLNRDDALGGAELLKRAIFGSDRLRTLAERPLLLTLMASLHAWRGGTLPEKREQLYADTVDLLLDWWERPKVVKDRDGKAKVLQPSLTEWLKLDRTKVRGLLNELAYRAHAEQADTQGTADIPEEWLISGLLDMSESPNVKPRLSGGVPER